MNETKSCPYCGEEILIDAKKCKHCGKWLEQKCPQCGEWVKAEAKKCRYCGYWLDPWQRRLQEKAEEEKAKAQNGANAEEIKAAIEEEKENQNAGCLLNVECFVIVVLIGLLYDWSWWGYLIGLFASYTLLSIHILRILYCIAISCVWGIIGVGISPYLFDESEFEITVRIATENYSDYWWMGAIFAIASLVFHWPAMKSRFNF